MIYRSISQYVSLLMLLLSITNQVMAQAHRLAIKRNYLALNFDYTRLLDADTSNILIRQYPGIAPVTLRSANNKGVNGIGLGVGVGHEWSLTPSWSWSLGGRLAHRELSPKGNASLLISGEKCSIPYQYNISSTLISVLVRLVYNHNLWQYYAELNTGINRLTSGSYKILHKGQTDHYADNTITQWTKGIAFGTIYYLSSTTSLGLSVGYKDLGKAKLGMRYTPTPASSAGKIEQRMRLLNMQFSITHWF